MTNFLRQETDFVVLVNVRLPSNVPGPYGKRLFSSKKTASTPSSFPPSMNSPVNGRDTTPRRSARMEDHSRKVSHGLLLKYGEILKSRGCELLLRQKSLRA
ncbi:MAG: hypothetical protein BJ554DRAFT_1936 [Olpidium bornovanus]|uniref:Uncharacterized protein n=1 Tax=Olpidium bornovanus TaxID=278681 RepID=A0A8H8DH29_9FUNG|nr:MAG: hypothetical protein BJ554DRAFT_1936 [Olpidium bornovanus]